MEQIETLPHGPWMKVSVSHLGKGYVGRGDAEEEGGKSLSFFLRMKYSSTIIEK